MTYRIRRGVGRRMLWLVTAALLGACTTWQPLGRDLDQAALRDLPYSLRVTRADGTRFTVLAPFVRGDSLLGRVVSDTVGIPLGQVKQLEREHFSPGRTAAVVLAIPATLFVVYLIACRGSRCEAQAVN